MRTWSRWSRMGVFGSMRRSSRRSLVPPLALLALLGCVAIAVRALIGAIHLDPLPSRPAAPAAMRVASIAARHAGQATHATRLVAAVENDPFQPDRRRPTERFRMPGETPPVPVTQTVHAAAAEAPLRLIGTVVRSNGVSSAMCQYAGETPRLVRVGQRIGDLTLKTVEQGRAVFVSADGATVEVHVPKAGA